MFGQVLLVFFGSDSLVGLPNGRGTADKNHFHRRLAESFSCLENDSSRLSLLTIEGEKGEGTTGKRNVRR